MLFSGRATKRRNIGTAAKRNKVFCRDHQAADNYEDSEDYYDVGIFGIVGIGGIRIDYFFLFLILSIALDLDTLDFSSIINASWMPELERSKKYTLSIFRPTACMRTSRSVPK